MKRREWKRELQDLFSIKSEEPVEALVDSLQRSQEVKFLFSDLIKQSWFKLMDLEMRRFEYAKVCFNKEIIPYLENKIKSKST